MQLLIWHTWFNLQLQKIWGKNKRLTSLKVTFLLAWGSSTIFCKFAATEKRNCVSVQAKIYIYPWSKKAHKTCWSSGFVFRRASLCCTSSWISLKAELCRVVLLAPLFFNKVAVFLAFTSWDEIIESKFEQSNYRGFSEVFGQKCGPQVPLNYVILVVSLGLYKFVDDQTTWARCVAAGKHLKTWREVWSRGQKGSFIPGLTSLVV